MTMREVQPQRGVGVRSSRPLRILSAVLLGVAAALLVSCGSSGKGLIPTGNAGPLQGDFEAVAQAAQSGDGSCATTAEAIRKTEQDFAALPASIDAGLRNTLRQGISNLRTRALVLCAQPLPQATVTTPPATTDTQPTTTTETTQTETQTTGTATTPSTPTATTPGGGTPAPGDGAEGTPGANGVEGGGTGAGEGSGNGGANGGSGSPGGGELGK